MFQRCYHIAIYVYSKSKLTAPPLKSLPSLAKKEKLAEQSTDFSPCPTAVCSESRKMHVYSTSRSMALWLAHSWKQQVLNDAIARWSEAIKQHPLLFFMLACGWAWLAANQTANVPVAWIPSWCMLQRLWKSALLLSTAQPGKRLPVLVTPTCLQFSFHWQNRFFMFTELHASCWERAPARGMWYPWLSRNYLGLRETVGSSYGLTSEFQVVIFVKRQADSYTAI